MSTACILVKVLDDQPTRPVNLNKSKICGTTQLVEFEKLIEDKEFKEVHPMNYYFFINFNLFQLEVGLTDSQFKMKHAIMRLVL